MDDYKELIERLRYERDDGSRDEAANAIESLLAENERFKYERDLAVQKMKDGWVRICNSGIQYYVVENAKLQAELDSIVMVMPYDYLDPPDGGNVPMSEQISRMWSEVKELRAELEKFNEVPHG